MNTQKYSHDLEILLKKPQKTFPDSIFCFSPLFITFRCRRVSKMKGCFKQFWLLSLSPALQVPIFVLPVTTDKLYSLFA